MGNCCDCLCRCLHIVGRTRTRGHMFKIRPKATHTNYLKYSLFHRYINNWNNLPGDILQSLSFHSFKTSLLNHLRLWPLFCITFITLFSSQCILYIFRPALPACILIVIVYDLCLDGSLRMGIKFPPTAILLLCTISTNWLK